MRDHVRMIRPLLDPAGVSDLRTAFADYTPQGVDAVLGLAGSAALDRGDLAGAAYAARGADGAVATLVRLFILGREASEDDARRAFEPLSIDVAEAAGLLERSAGSVRARLDVRPYSEACGDAPWWVVSDLGSEVRGGAALPHDHVLGVGAASLTLAQSTPRDPVARALDVGTGCGVQALHLSRHAARVTATDVSTRALTMAATTAALSGCGWELRAGSLLEPVAGRRYDLVVANPPFVVSAGAVGYDYRDSGLVGDDVCRSLVIGLPGVLDDGGAAQLLANWVIPRDGAWEERLAGWMADSPCDAWIWQREIAEPAEYVAMWLRDAGELPGSPTYNARYDAWLDWMDGAGIAAVGMGLITLWKTARADPIRVFENVPQGVEQPAGPHIGTWIARQRGLRDLDDAHLLAAKLTVAPGVVLERADLLAPGQGWTTASTRLRASYGMRWDLESDEAIASLVAGCDGRTPLAAAIGMLGAALDTPATDVVAAALPVVRDLVSRGLLELPT